MRVNQIKAFNTSDSEQVANIISVYLPHTCSQSAKGQLRKYKKKPTSAIRNIRFQMVSVVCIPETKNVG